MTSPEQETQAVAPASRLAALRGNCMGTAVLLIIEFGLGVGVNLYATIPRNKSFVPAAFGSAVLAAHAIMALLLLGSAIGALIRAIRARIAIVVTSAGFAAILAAGIAGSTFAGQPKQRRLAGHGAGHRGGHVLLPGRGLQPPLAARQTRGGMMHHQARP